jgi:hypothetical protein
MFFFQFFHVVPKVMIKEDSCKFGYEINKKTKHLRILLHVHQPLEPIS